MNEHDRKMKELDLEMFKPLTKAELLELGSRMWDAVFMTDRAYVLADDMIEEMADLYAMTLIK